MRTLRMWRSIFQSCPLPVNASAVPARPWQSTSRAGTFVRTVPVCIESLMPGSIAACRWEHAACNLFASGRRAVGAIPGSVTLNYDPGPEQTPDRDLVVRPWVGIPATKASL